MVRWHLVPGFRSSQILAAFFCGTLSSETLESKAAGAVIDTLTPDGACNLLHGAQSGATLALALLLLYERQLAQGIITAPGKPPALTGGIL